MPILIYYVLALVGAEFSSAEGVFWLTAACLAAALMLVFRHELSPLAEKARAYAQALAENITWRTDP